MRYAYPDATRSPHRPRGKWHLLVNRTFTVTICGENTRGWDVVDRGDLDPRAICTNCLRDTP